VSATDAGLQRNFCIDVVMHCDTLYYMEYDDLDTSAGNGSGSNPGGGASEAGRPGSHDDRPPRDETRWEERARTRAEGETMDERRQQRARKERVLHTRISEQLSEDIRQLAEDLRVPTSNLVRNVLEEVFTAVENVTDDVGGLFEEVLEEADAARDRVRRRYRGSARRRQRRSSQAPGRSWSDVAEEEIRDDEAGEERESAAREHPAPPDFPDVIGWQPLVLNQSGACADCSRSLRRGTRVFVGVTENGLSRHVLCRECLERR